MNPESSAAAATAYLMFLDQSAHLDWDWIKTFDGFYKEVEPVLTQALANLAFYNTSSSRPYYYSICEMGFLRRFVQGAASRGEAILEAGDNFQVLGGGVTSPDCLVCSGEGFVRNYLVGRIMLSECLPGLQARPHCVIPDDFGQGPELPVLLQALGFTGLVFSRLPGNYTPNRVEPTQQLLDHGVDFVWRASDGSEVVTHWILSPPNTDNYGYADPGNDNGDGIWRLRPISDLVACYQPAGTLPTYSAAATRYMYFPVENDFSKPVDGLLQKIDEWNTQDSKASGVRVQAGTLDDFMRRVLALKDQLQVLAPYNGTPYWTGFYASRPQLKILHYKALRALLEAEVFGLLAGEAVPSTFHAGVAAAWEAFAPSTHHDYVTGTSPDDVYQGEQLPGLGRVAKQAGELRAQSLAALAAAAAVAGGPPVLVANGLGFARTDLVELAGPPGGASAAAVQPSFEGGSLFVASAPSFGWQTLDPAALADPGTSAASVEPAAVGATSYTLANEHLRLTIDEASNWGIASLVDRATGADVLAGTGNDLVFYEDGGGIYRFGNESSGDQTFEVDTGVAFTTSGAGLGATVLEAGPLRVRVSTSVLVSTSDGPAGTFVREYTLVAGEPFVRMTTTGAAPSGYSVMCRFPTAAAAKTISHGTAGHWTAVQPLDGFWDPPVFRATHDFVLACAANGDTLAAAYHGAIPAWAIDAAGALIGCVLRNTPLDAYGAGGSDDAVHTQRYALRVPSGLAGPRSGQPLREARRFSTPLRAVAIPAHGAGAAASHALASASEPAILTVAKPGSFDPASLILRLYQATNAPAETQVAVGPATTATVVTALEGPWLGPETTLTPTQTGFTLRMTSAIATVRLDGLGATVSG